MIVVDVKLVSAISSTRNTNLFTMVISNDGTSENGNRGDYTGKMYRKNDTKFKTPTRTAYVKNHARKAEPVQNLVSKMMKEMGYG